MKTSTQADDRFRRDADKYAAYLDTPEGHLRLDLALATVQEFLPGLGGDHTLSALDLGCGTGAAAVRLAQLGFHVTQLDSSPAMLNLAEREARAAGVNDRVTLQAGDAGRSAILFPGGSFDLILCHNLLEYVEDPGTVLSAAARLMRDSSALLSVLVRNQAGEVLKAAIQAGDLAAAKDALTAEWGQESLYGGRVRLFAPDGLRNVLRASGFSIIAERGVRVAADYLPPEVSRSEQYARISELEAELGKRPEFAAVARYIQFLARRASNEQWV